MLGTTSSLCNQNCLHFDKEQLLTSQKLIISSTWEHGGHSQLLSFRGLLTIDFHLPSFNHYMSPFITAQPQLVIIQSLLATCCSCLRRALYHYWSLCNHQKPISNRYLQLSHHSLQSLLVNVQSLFVTIQPKFVIIQQAFVIMLSLYVLCLLCLLCFCVNVSFSMYLLFMFMLCSCL